MNEKHVLGEQSVCTEDKPAEIVPSQRWLRRVAEKALTQLRLGHATREQKFMIGALEGYLKGDSLDDWFPTPTKKPGRPRNEEKNRKVSLQVVIYRAAGLSKSKAIERVTEELELEEDQVKMIYERDLKRSRETH